MGKLPIGDWVEGFVDWVSINGDAAFVLFTDSLSAVVQGLEELLLAAPELLIVGVFAAIGTWRLSWRFGGFAALALGLLINLNLWPQTMASLALVLIATLISLVMGVPLGILCSRSNRLEGVVRPLLDFMQTMPAFVYLIPAAMFFGLGQVPGIVATVVFAMPPAVRLTNLGIRQVSPELIEAGRAFGCSRGQLLRKVQLPMAWPSIMAGINQTVMLALSMIVIASMIGAGGLGNEVLTGIQRMDIGKGFESGLGVVLLAVLLDRISQSFAKNT